LRRSLRFAWLIVLGAAMIAPAVPVRATPPDTQPSAERGRERRGGREHFGRGGPRGMFAGLGELGIGNILPQPQPEDHGPLRPGEEAKLLAFVQEHLPRMHRVMLIARARQPERFRAQLAERAPQLRRLKQIYERDPEIGRLFKQHAENLLEVRRLMRTMRHGDPHSPLYDVARQELRERLAENVRIELRSLELLAQDTFRHLSQRVDERLAWLLGPDADLSRIPPPLREHVRDFRAANSDEQRRAARRGAAELVREHLERELLTARDRIEQMRTGAADEVDRRLERVLTRIERGERGPHRRGPRP
jgi:hypothetical protein